MSDPAAPAPTGVPCSTVASPAQQFAADVRRGLSATPKSLPCKYLYDRRGSQLFEQICATPEYYLTRAETEILRAVSDELPATVLDGGAGVQLVEMGSGSAVKTELVIEAFMARGPVHYVPVDVSRSALASSVARLLAHHPGLTIAPVAGEYEDVPALLSEPAAAPRLVLWLGSSIGNLERAAAAGLLGRLHAGAAARPVAFLIGFDLRKPASVLLPAYDDAGGVTAAFNRNLLRRINRELGGDFRPDAFLHRASYDERAGRMDMHLVSPVRHRARIAALDDLDVVLAAGEPIHTESSFKYSRAEVAALAAAAGLQLRSWWTDGRDRFALALLGR